jgi:hypothetical protein
MSAVYGVRHCQRALREVGKKSITIAGQSAAFAMRPVRKRARDTAPRRSGLLRKSIGTKRKQRKNVAYALVGVRAGRAKTIRGTKRDPARYGHIVEKKQPFMGPALDSQRGSVQHAFMREFDRRLKIKASELRARQSARGR